MFTGLIESVGQVASVSEHNGTRRLTIAARELAGELKQGDSVSVSGVCLTAVTVEKDSFAADLAAETIARTSLSRLAPKTLVNLELPMKAGSRLGGHIVQGHVDGVGTLTALEKVRGGEDYWLRVSLPSELVRYVVFKGSIAIEGISLTVAAIEKNELSVAIIPHTFQATNLRALRPGAPLNIEVDVFAKYAERLLAQKPANPALTLERLREEGF
jgi:riboflavin synthase